MEVHHAESLARRLIDRDALPSDDDIGASAVAALSDDLLPRWNDDWAVIAAADWHQPPLARARDGKGSDRRRRPHIQPTPLRMRSGACGAA